jgi:butyrate kinase
VAAHIQAELVAVAVAAAAAIAVACSVVPPVAVELKTDLTHISHKTEFRREHWHHN